MSVTNDLTTDQRVKKVCESLNALDYDILLIGRILPDSIKLNRPYKCKRIKLFFNKGFLFYAEYNLRLFFLLLFSKVDIFHANDLDTLLPNYLAARIRRKPIVYDSHEYFTGVPEIQNKTLVKNVWLTIERWIFPKLKYIFTVNQSIAQLYKEEYNKDLRILRNIPHKLQFKELKSKSELNIPEDKDIIITQGAGINIDRGIEEAVEAMQYLEDVCLMIIGNGDVIPKLKKRVLELKLENSIIFRGRMPYHEMMQYTQHAQLGLTLDKNTNINYRFSLPNKLFDYIHAGIPILATKVIEIEKIINKYKIGLFIDNHEPKHIAQQIRLALNNKKLNTEWKSNINLAADELHWGSEEKILKEVYNKIEG
ncbi:MAG: glycosyltransferase [Flavobacteriales bacterium]|nr:glycosyltransferase [Flavobacteriales bacterium]